MQSSTPLELRYLSSPVAHYLVPVATATSAARATGPGQKDRKEEKHDNIIVEEYSYGQLLRTAIEKAYFSDSQNSAPSSIDAEIHGRITEDDASMIKNKRKRKQTHRSNYWWLVPGEAGKLHRRLQVAKTDEMRLAIQAAERAKELEWEKRAERYALLDLNDSEGSGHVRMLYPGQPPLMLTDGANASGVGTSSGIERTSQALVESSSYLVEQRSHPAKHEEDPKNPLFFPARHLARAGPEAGAAAAAAARVHASKRPVADSAGKLVLRSNASFPQAEKGLLEKTEGGEHEHGDGALARGSAGRRRKGQVGELTSGLARRSDGRKYSYLKTPTPYGGDSAGAGSIPGVDGALRAPPMTFGLVLGMPRAVPPVLPSHAALWSREGSASGAGAGAGAGALHGSTEPCLSSLASSSSSSSSSSSTPSGTMGPPPPPAVLPPPAPRVGPSAGTGTLAFASGATPLGAYRARTGTPGAMAGWASTRASARGGIDAQEEVAGRALGMGRVEASSSTLLPRQGASGRPRGGPYASGSRKHGVGGIRRAPTPLQRAAAGRSPAAQLLAARLGGKKAAMRRK